MIDTVVVENSTGERVKAVESTVFSLPNPDGWLVSLGQDGLLDDHPCLDEPIDSSSFWGGFMDSRLGHGDFAVPDIDGVFVRSVRISVTGKSSREASEQFWIEDNSHPPSFIEIDQFVRATVFSWMKETNQ